jgi:transcriptional regulator with XRE-family HTH domain
VTVGQRIKTLREIAGITKSDLGRACGYEYPYAYQIVNRWESGCWDPSVKQLWPICHCLGITLDTLLPEPCVDNDTKEYNSLAQQMTGKPLELLYIEDQVG